MSKSVLIVEKDLSLLKELHAALQERGFEVDETTDGKGALEMVRRTKPGCVVLAVDLDAGQNGYIICKKLKTDDELKTVPVIIIGDPKGFGQHQKLKTRAEDYVEKPLSADVLVDGVGKLIGFPEVAAIENESASLESFEEDVSVESSLDFETSSATHVEEEINLTPPEFEELDSLAEKTIVGIAPNSAPGRTAPFQSSPSSIDGGEAREMRAKVTELTGALEDARLRTEELEARIREVESEVEAKNAELETARAAPGKTDSKEVFALRDAANKKDKEILKLKNELNGKEAEIVELREKENTLEQQLSEANSELGARDAQLKSLQAKADQLGADKKRVDQQLASAKEEGRASAAMLQTLQADYDVLQQRATDLDQQLESLRNTQHETEMARQSTASELASAQGEIEALKSQVDEHAREVDETRGQLVNTQVELDSARSQITTQATSFADEISALRQRMGDAESQTAQAEEKIARVQARLKTHQERFERLRETLQNTVDTMGEMPGESEEVEIDEVAEA